MRTTGGDKGPEGHVVQPVEQSVAILDRRVDQAALGSGSLGEPRENEWIGRSGATEVGKTGDDQANPLWEAGAYRTDCFEGAVRRHPAQADLDERGPTLGGQACGVRRGQGLEGAVAKGGADRKARGCRVPDPAHGARRGGSERPRDRVLHVNDVGTPSGRFGGLGRVHNTNQKSHGRHYSVAYRAEQGDQPQVTPAVEYVRWTVKCPPGEAEREKAVRATGEGRYPWGRRFSGIGESWEAN